MVTMWSPLHSDSPRFTGRDRWRATSDYAGMSGMESDGAPRPPARNQKVGCSNHPGRTEKPASYGDSCAPVGRRGSSGRQPYGAWPYHTRPSRRRRLSGHPDADAVTISAALRWPLVVVEQLLADLEQQGMIAPPTRH